jgi:hypothetical protein
MNRFCFAELLPVFRKLLLFQSVFCVGSSSASFAQSITKYQIGADLEVSSLISSTDATPFWMRSNQYGSVPTTAPAGLLHGRIWRSYSSRDSLTPKTKRFDWGFSINPVTMLAAGSQSRMILPEAYGKVKWGPVEFYAGRRKELMGIGDSTLSSGFFIGSGNAMPIPKVQIATVGYVPLSFTGGFVAINAGFAHGWINSPPYIQGARLHQKYIYLKLGPRESRVKFSFGINHEVLWAGYSEDLKRSPELAVNGQLPSSWKFFPYVVFSYTPKDWYKRAGYTSFDSYRLGNHLGTYDAAVEVKLKDKKLMVYHQHPYEDLSGVLFKNAPDGLWGVNYALQVDKFKPWGLTLTHITAEFLTTKSQTGSTFYIPGSKYQGQDNYFNHGQYANGWSYRGRTIGTPFIIPKADLTKVTEDAVHYFPNTRLNMWYLGTKWTYREAVLFTVRTSYSRNFGVSGNDFPVTTGQFSGLVEAQFPMPQWYHTHVTAKVAMDAGGLFKNTVGLQIGVRKSW